MLSTSLSEEAFLLLFLNVLRLVLHCFPVFSSLDFSDTPRTITVSNYLVLSMNESTALADLLSCTSIQMITLFKNQSKNS